MMCHCHGTSHVVSLSQQRMAARNPQHRTLRVATDNGEARSTAQHQVFRAVTRIRRR